jgi:pimeloyl-ACP methyl ester carboxylesterase
MAETATINGTDLAYIEHGRGQPVVFVHGGVGDYREWDLQVPAFAASFRTHRPELPRRLAQPEAQGRRGDHAEHRSSRIWRRSSRRSTWRPST